MSLYSTIADKLSKDGLTGNLQSGLGAALGKPADAAAQAMGGGLLGKTVARAGQSMAVNAAMQAVNRHVPLHTQRIANVGAGAIGDAMRGDWEGAGLRVLDSHLLDGALNKIKSGASAALHQARFELTPTPWFGGLSPVQARQLYDQSRHTPRVKKNLWWLEVTSRLGGGALNMPARFNMLATELEYAPYILTGDKRRVGGAVLDAVHGNEPVELRMTTTDDGEGNLKRWFAAHHAAVAARDGTVGVPDDYAIRFKIVHGAISEDTAQGRYVDLGLFRPVNMDVSLSRRDDAPQDLQMAFSQLDTFMRAD